MNIEYRCRRCSDTDLLDLLYNIEHKNTGLAPHFPLIKKTHSHFCEDGGAAIGDFIGVSPRTKELKNEN
jgi:hypothetical protein